MLPVGRQLQGSTERDPARFGFSKPCVRCLRALEEFGVHRVIFTTGKQDADGSIGCEVGVVHELLAAARQSGHCSRGDEGAIACGALRPYEELGPTVSDAGHEAEPDERLPRKGKPGRYCRPCSA